MKPPGLGRTIAIGFVAGLVATAAKTVCEKIAPPRPPGVPSPLGNALQAGARKITGGPLREETKEKAEPVAHFLFGAGAGVAYALIARELPEVRSGRGVWFGISFWLAAHEIALPLLGLSPSPARMSAWEQGNEFVSHGLFGATLEFVRQKLARVAR